MASSPKFVCLFFILTTLVFSLQTYARDSQFFSKVTRNRDEAPTTTTTPNTNTFYMNTKEHELEHLNKQQEQDEQPTFLPQTTETGYGLYGHETGLDPPATTTTTTSSLYNMDENNNNNNNSNYEDFDSYFKNNNEDHEKNYAPELKGLSSTTYSTNVAPTKYVNNFNNNNNNYNNEKEGKYYYNDNNNNDDEKNGKYYYNNNENYNNIGGAKYNDVQEKQGMSDTRFLENGKYYYDVNGEKNYQFNNNYLSHSNNYNNNFETNGYYGNNNKANRFDVYYDAYNRNNNNNNNNEFFSGNSVQGYQNQVPQEEEFAFDDQP